MQERNGLPARHCDIGAERGRAGASRNTLFYRPDDRVGVVRAGRHIEEVDTGRRGLSDGKGRILHYL